MIYKSAFKEKILNGQIKVYHGQPTSLVREIESHKEYEDIPDNCRGVFFSNTLYMVTNPNAPIIHSNIFGHLADIKIYKGGVEFLRVIKREKWLWLGEGSVNQLDRKEKGFLESYEKRMKELNIRYRYEEV